MKKTPNLPGFTNRFHNNMRTPSKSPELKSDFYRLSCENPKVYHFCGWQVWSVGHNLVDDQLRAVRGMPPSVGTYSIKEKLDSEKPPKLQEMILAKGLY